MNFHRQCTMFFFWLLFISECTMVKVCVLVCLSVILVDAHKFIIRNLSSSETLNRIKDNKLEISGWTIYDCGDFTRKERCAHRAWPRIASNITHLSIMSVEHLAKAKAAAKQNSKQLEYYRRHKQTNVFIYVRVLLEPLWLVASAIINHLRSLLYIR